jgi:hypothetical protein
MTQKRYTVLDVMKEARAEVDQWPEWKRSDDVRQALRELEERKRAAQQRAPAQAEGKKEEEDG